jgi:hypothetical protein
MMKQVLVKHFEKDRLKLVSIPVVECEDRAVLEEQDFNDLMERSVSAVWRLKNGIITTRCNQRGVAVARLILDVKPGQIVQYLDGNSFNLRRGNLIVNSGISKYKAQSLIKKELRRARVRLHHVYE